MTSCSYGLWDAAGSFRGHERGEGVLDALRREVEEESGCIVEPLRLVSIDSRVTPPEMLVHVFACRHVGGAPRAREATVPEAGWFAPVEARRLVTRSPAAERLRDALELDGVRHRTYRLLLFESPSAEVSD